MWSEIEQKRPWIANHDIIESGNELKLYMKKKLNQLESWNVVSLTMSISVSVIHKNTLNSFWKILVEFWLNWKNPEPFLGIAGADVNWIMKRIGRLTFWSSELSLWMCRLIVERSIWLWGEIIQSITCLCQSHIGA